ncbi:hypothetical protein MAFF211271_40250 (plasmid) [Ralstonia syzygii subsp. indonesiensis]|nr:hypothetical protein MAFF211271_40250 [Ralstonia pseudosolanacearum]
MLGTLGMVSAAFDAVTVEQGSPVTKQAFPKKRVWSHTLFAHLYDSRDVAEKLKVLYGADQGYKEPQSRKSALFAVKFTADGLMVDGSPVLIEGSGSRPPCLAPARIYISDFFRSVLEST